jgi:hypothetical protein
MTGRTVEVAWYRAASVRPVEEFLGPWDTWDDIARLLKSLSPYSSEATGRAIEIGVRGDAVRAMRSPCVYLLWRGDSCLYVGMSTAGLTRPLSSSHHAIGSVETDDYLQVFFVSDEIVADLEWWLIRLLKPERNGRGAHQYRDGVLGMAARNKWICGWGDCSADAVYRVQRRDGRGYWCCESHMDRWEE